MKPAVVGNTTTLVMLSARAMTIRLDVSRGVQRFTRDYQLVTGKPFSVGHLEGWAFGGAVIARTRHSGLALFVVATPRPSVIESYSGSL